jgi:hypothetical protein
VPHNWAQLPSKVPPNIWNLGNALVNFSVAAVERVPEIKPEDVEEVFFGNVLSAK